MNKGVYRCVRVRMCAHDLCVCVCVCVCVCDCFSRLQSMAVELEEAQDEQKQQRAVCEQLQAKIAGLQVIHRQTQTIIPKAKI